VAALVLAALGGCGKKGPPLTPIVRIPAGVDDLAARRVGSEVYLTMTLPGENIDASMPAALARVDVYGATALTPPPRARFLEIATLLGSIPAQPAADPETPDAVLPPPDPKSGAAQGAMATLRDELAADELIPRELPVLETERPRLPQPASVAVRPVTALRRFYMAIPVSTRGQTGPPSQLVELPLTPLPEPPSTLRSTLGEAGVTLQWDASGGLLGWLLDRGLPTEQPPFPAPPAPATAAPAVSAELPPGPTQYNVYRQLAPDPLALPGPLTAPMPWDVAAPVAANQTPLAVLTWGEEVPLDGRPRCYTVRSVRGTGARRVEGDASAPVCVLPIDLVPPVAPTGLQAIAAEGAISLIWEPNVEEDLAGFIVLRREAGSDTLLPLTPSPISETRFTDRVVAPGMRYTYEVRAVDSRVPLPNVSDPAEVSETAR
jgi:hypothetical protein